MFTLAGFSNKTAGFEVETSETLNDSIASTSLSSTRSISTTFGPVSPAWNVTSTSLDLKSSSLAVVGLVLKL
jgi:hypothetical protein